MPNMNAGAMMKLLAAKSQAERNHPKFAEFLKHFLSSGVSAGTVIEVSVTEPDGKVTTSNLRVQQSDLDLLESLRELQG